MIGIALLTLTAAGAWADAWLDDFDAAKKAAAAAGKSILVDATGSDWALPCRQMEAEVFSRPDFLATVTDRYVLLRLDYPRNRTQPEKLRVQNKQLAQRFSLTVFPTYLVLDAQGVPFGRHEGYVAGGVAGFAALTADLQTHQAALAALADAVKKAAAGSAKALAEDALFRQADAWGLATQYADLPLKIIQDDKDGSAGVKARYQVYNAYQRLLGTWSDAEDYHKPLADLEQLAGRASSWPDLKQSILFTKGMVWLNALGEEVQARDTFRVVRSLGPTTALGMRAAELLDKLP
jgi:thioredoxin-related protein